MIHQDHHEDSSQMATKKQWGGDEVSMDFLRFETNPSVDRMTQRWRFSKSTASIGVDLCWLMIGSGIIIMLDPKALS